MRLKDSDYKFLLSKYSNEGLFGKDLEERLRRIDPYISLDNLKLTLPPLCF